MSSSTLKLKLTLLLSLLAIMSYSQKDEYRHYKITKEAALNVDLQHTELHILPSDNDSIVVHMRIKAIQTNPEALHSGIILSTQQNTPASVNVTLSTDQEIQPHNRLDAICEIHIPKHVTLNLKSRYGIVHINTPARKIDAKLTYSNLTIDTLSQEHTHAITSEYSSIILNSTANHINFNGINSSVKAQTIKHLKSKSEFTGFAITRLISAEIQSYTDKFILSSVDSIHINSEKSLCIINKLGYFFQGEMQAGALTIDSINAEFETINISNSHVTSQLSFDKTCHFSLNADMRYCSLIQETITLQETISPNSLLYNGSYGTSKDKSPNLSIISNYGDVSIFFK